MSAGAPSRMTPPFLCPSPSPCQLLCSPARRSALHSSRMFICDFLCGSRCPFCGHISASNQGGGFLFVPNSQQASTKTCHLQIKSHFVIAVMMPTIYQSLLYSKLFVKNVTYIISFNLLRDLIKKLHHSDLYLGHCCLAKVA